jgi:integrase
MAVIKRTRLDGSIGYQVKIRDPDGRWYPSPTYDLIEQAQAEELRLKALKLKGAKAISADAQQTSVDEYWEVWSVENRSEVSEGWKMSQDQMYRDYVKPEIGRLKLSKVTTPEIGRVMNKMQALGRSDQMRLHVYNLLHKMFSDAVDYYEMLASNPVKAAHHRTRVRLTKRDFLLPAQAFYFLEKVKATSYGPAVWLQILSGLRPGEVQALRWKSVQFELGQILIAATYSNKVKALQDFPKQEDWGLTPMPVMLQEYLAPRKKGPEEFVAPGPKGRMLQYVTYLKALRRLCAKAGLPIMTPHELRHTCTEIYVQAGASEEDIGRLLQQKSREATKRYMHRTEGRLRAIAGRVGNPSTPVAESGAAVGTSGGNGNEMFPNMFPNGNKEAFILEAPLSSLLQ